MTTPQTTLVPFQLPDGYSLEPPSDLREQMDVLGITVPGEKLYGGADISDCYDAVSTHWVFCCASKEGDDPPFRFRAFARQSGETSYSERPLPFIATGRGNADVQWIDGVAHATGWEGNAFYPAAVPGFVAFPSIPSLAERIMRLEASGGGDVPADVFTRLDQLEAQQAELNARVISLEQQTAAGIVFFPSVLTSNGWEGRTINGGVVVNVPAVFGAPSAAAYLIRFVAMGHVNVRVRAGASVTNPLALTMNLQVEGLQSHIQGWSPTSNATDIYVSTVNGAATIWLQIVGYC